MPGIAGLFAPVASAAFEHQLQRMLTTLVHQPDSAAATISAPELGIYGGWVAHRGSAATLRGTAPADASVQWAVAGEWLDAAPSAHEAYREHGAAFVAQLNGLFAGLLIDRQRRTALLFNDRYGSQRLYTADRDGVIYFASEAKALLAVLPELRAFDEIGVAQYLAFGSTLDGQTLFKGVALMPGGSCWHRLPDGGVRRERYFDPRQWEALEPLSSEDFQRELSATMREVVPAMVSGALPVGLSLTGGLDTRMIAACLRADAAPALTYTYAADGGDRLLDLSIARRVAAQRGWPHHALRLNEQFLAQFAQHLDRTVWISDGNAGVLGAHELPLSEQARALAPVRLTGNFGSEVLRSMSTFKRNGPGPDLLEPDLAKRIDTLVSERARRKVHPVTHAAFEEVPWHLFGTLAVSRSQLTFRTPFMDNRIVELAYRAPLHGRLTAEPSLRLIHDNDPALAALPTDRGVAWATAGPGVQFRRLAAEITFKLDYWHKEGLPDGLGPYDRWLGSLSRLGWLGLHKFLAYRLWFRTALAPHAEQVVSDARTRGLPFWDRNVLSTIVRDHVRGRRNRLHDIHAVLTLEAVHRLLINDQAYRAGKHTHVPSGAALWPTP
jgi:asparagine synthase (glutamine-hydrolysing)